jgi:type 1 fimbria pilin
MAASASASAADVPIAAGEVSAVSTITMTYAIEP